MPGTTRSLILVLAFLALPAPASLYSQGHAPDKAVSQMTVADGLQVRLVASEPEIRQPILVKVDDRGRLWTIQYLQYPNPAGLERVKVDRWSRTIYDRIPKPPPHGPRGADRVTILDRPFLLVEGVLQLQDGVTSVKAECFHDFAFGEVTPESRNFC